MRIESSLSSKSLLLIQGCLFFFIALLFLKTVTHAYVFVGAAGLGLLVLSLYKFPNLVFPLFIMSLFWGQLLFRNAEIGITISDPLFFLVLLGYLSTLINPDISRCQIGENDRPLLISFSILIVTMLLSLAVNAAAIPENYLVYGLIKLVYMIKYLLAFIVVYSLYMPDNGKNVLKIIFLLSLIQLPIVVFQYSFTGGTNETEINRSIMGTMSYHHGMLGTYALMPFFLAIGYALITRRQILKAGYFLMAAAFLIMVILSATRSALLGLIISTVIFLALNLKWKRSSLKYVTFTLAAAVAVYFLTPVRQLIQATLNQENIVDVSSAGRILMWHGAWEYFINADLLHKIFGAGFGCYFLIPQSHVIFSGFRRSFGAHNNFLNSLCETGLAGFLAFMVFFGIVLWVLYRRKHPLAQAFFFATIAMLFSGLTQETFWVTTAFHNLWLFYMVILALVLKISGTQQETK